MKAKQLKGQSVMYRTETYFVKDIRVDDEGTHVLTTDKGILKLTSSQVANDLLPVADEETPEATQRSLVMRLTADDANDIKELSAMVMDGIRRVQQDPEFIDQARAINEGAKVIVDIKKLVIDAVRVVRGA